MVSLCSPGSPRTHSVNWVDLELRACFCLQSFGVKGGRHHCQVFDLEHCIKGKNLIVETEIRDAFVVCTVVSSFIDTVSH